MRQEGGVQVRGALVLMKLKVWISGELDNGWLEGVRFEGEGAERAIVTMDTLSSRHQILR